MIFAHGPTDTFSKHRTSDRGARSINLLNYVKNVPPPKTAKYFDVVSANVSKIEIIFMKQPMNLLKCESRSVQQ